MTTAQLNDIGIAQFAIFTFQLLVNLAACKIKTSAKNAAFNRINFLDFINKINDKPI